MSRSSYAWRKTKLLLILSHCTPGARGRWGGWPTCWGPRCCSRCSGSLVHLLTPDVLHACSCVRWVPSTFILGNISSDCVSPEWISSKIASPGFWSSELLLISEVGTPQQSERSWRCVRSDYGHNGKKGAFLLSPNEEHLLWWILQITVIWNSHEVLLATGWDQGWQDNGMALQHE